MIVGIFLLGIATGGLLNAGNWAVYIGVLGLSVDQVKPFALTLFALTWLMAVLFITFRLYQEGHELNFKKMAHIAPLLAVIAGLAYGASLLPADWRDTAPQVLKWLVLGGFLAVFVIALYRILRRSDEARISAFAFLTPLLPLSLILLLNMNFIAAFICGLIYGFMVTYRPGRLNLLIQSVFEGGSVVIPAVILMFGIGMLLNAIIGPGESWQQHYPQGWPVLLLLRPVMIQIIPQNGIVFFLLFAFAAPLALYRGPLNLWGMGYGLAAAFLAGGMNPGALMGILMSMGQVQAISDPTNTQNVWLANEMNQDVQKVMWITLPYAWFLAACGVLIASLRYF